MFGYEDLINLPWPEIQAIAASGEPVLSRRVHYMLSGGVASAQSLWGVRHPGEVAASEARIYRYLRPVADKLRDAGGWGAGWPCPRNGYHVVYPQWMKATNESSGGYRWPQVITHSARGHMPLATAVQRLTAIFGDGGPTLADVEKWAHQVWVENLLDSPTVVVGVPDLRVLMADWGCDLSPEVVRSRAKSALPWRARGIPHTAWRISHCGMNTV